jgi:hypothetical protein
MDTSRKRILGKFSSSLYIVVLFKYLNAWVRQQQMKIAFWKSVLHVLGLSYFIFLKTSQRAFVSCLLLVQLQAVMCYCQVKRNNVLVYLACCLSICRP